MGYISQVASVRLIFIYIWIKLPIVNYIKYIAHSIESNSHTDDEIYIAMD